MMTSRIGKQFDCVGENNASLSPQKFCCCTRCIRCDGSKSGSLLIFGLEGPNVRRGVEEMGDDLHKRDCKLLYVQVTRRENCLI